MSTNVGISRMTPFKQEDLESLLSSQIYRLECVQLKYKNEPWMPKEVLIMDCSCGDCSPERTTSPQLFIQYLLQTRFLKARLYLLEKDKKTFSVLEKNVKRFFPKLSRKRRIKVGIACVDMKDVLSKLKIPKYMFGLIYFDPNGFVLEDYQALFSFLRKYKRIDIIMNVNVTMLKRLRAVRSPGFEKYNEFFFSDVLKGIDKKNVWIRDNVRLRELSVIGRHEFVMVYGTNMQGCDIGHVENFVPVNSPEGEAIMSRYEYTKKELLEENLCELMKLK